MEPMERALAEPYRIKMVERIPVTTRPEREEAIRRAGHNTFLLRSEEVTIDLLTDSGTSAMSDAQWAALMRGDEAYAGSASYYALEEAVREVYGYPEVVPTHQGRGAEHIVSSLLIDPGDVIPGNMYFTTTRFHQERAGGRFADVIVEEAHRPDDPSPFKGNVDLARLEAVVEEAGAGRVPYVSVGATVNMAGGQPVSMANVRAVSALCRERGILVVLDAARALENAFFIQEREPGHQDRTVAEILRELCSHTDAATVSAKKDGLVNIGGFLALRDPGLAERARAMLVAYEGLHTYGGMAGRDMAALARGLREMVDGDEHVRHRVGQVRYLGETLDKAGVPVVRPIGGHGVFVDAASFLPHLSQDHLPAQSLAAALYVDSGVRGMERGIVSAGRDPETGDHRRPSLELLRLAIPRRVYTRSHLDVVAESVVSLHQQPEAIGGLRFTFEPEHLRFFQARFAPLS